MYENMFGRHRPQQMSHYVFTIFLRVKIKMCYTEIIIPNNHEYIEVTISV